MGGDRVRPSSPSVGSCCWVAGSPTTGDVSERSCSASSVSPSPPASEAGRPRTARPCSPPGPSREPSARSSPRPPRPADGAVHRREGTGEGVRRSSAARAYRRRWRGGGSAARRRADRIRDVALVPMLVNILIALVAAAFALDDGAGEERAEGNTRYDIPGCRSGHARASSVWCTGFTSGGRGRLGFPDHARFHHRRAGGAGPVRGGRAALQPPVAARAHRVWTRPAAVPISPRPSPVVA